MKRLRPFSGPATITGAVVVALALTTLMLAMVGKPPGQVYTNLLRGAFGTLVEQESLDVGWATCTGNFDQCFRVFGDWIEEGAGNLFNKRTADTITFWVPLLLCSTGLLLTFTGGLWNIGIEGQMTMGAVAASFVALQVSAVTLPSSLVMVAPADTAGAITSVDELRRRPVGVMQSDTLDGVNMPAIKLNVFDEDFDAAAEGLRDGTVEVVIAAPDEAWQLIATGDGLAQSEVKFARHLPGWLLLVMGLVAAMIGGGLWALLCGVLKTRGQVHEIFGGVALNNLASIFAIYLISGPWQPPEGGSAQATPKFPTYTLLPRLERFDLSPLALGLAVGLFVVVYLALRGTFWGLQLRAMGKNPRSAFLLGVPTEKHTLIAFGVCGALAGLGGSARALGFYGDLRPNIAGGIGFLALLVVLLARVRGALVPFISFFFAAVLSGSTQLQVKMGLDASLVGVLQGVLVLAVILALGVRGRLTRQREDVVVGAGAVSASRAPANPTTLDR